MSHFKIKNPKPLNHWRNMLKCYGTLFSIIVSVNWNVLFFMVFLSIVLKQLYFLITWKLISVFTKYSEICDILLVHNKYNIPRPFCLIVLQWMTFALKIINEYDEWNFILTKVMIFSCHWLLMIRSPYFNIFGNS